MFARRRAARDAVGLSDRLYFSLPTALHTTPGTESLAVPRTVDLSCLICIRSGSCVYFLCILSFSCIFFAFEHRIYTCICGARKTSFLPRHAMHKRSLYRRAVSVCPSVRLSVTFVYSVEMSKRIFNIFTVG